MTFRQLLEKPYDPLENPFAQTGYSYKPTQSKFKEVSEGITPTTFPLALIIGLVVGIIAHGMAGYFTSNAHHALYASMGAGGAATAFTIGHAVLSVRKDLDEKKDVPEPITDLHLQD